MPFLDKENDIARFISVKREAGPNYWVQLLGPAIWVIVILAEEWMYWMLELFKLSVKLNNDVTYCTF